MQPSSKWEPGTRKTHSKKRNFARIELIIPGIILTVLISLIILVLFKRNQKAPEFRVISSVLTEQKVRELIVNRNFYALDWNDNGAGYPNQYEIRDIDGDKIIIDEKSGLTWQQAGSSKPAPANEVQQYIRQLNKQKFAGFTNWRLPTLEEAMTLVEPYTNIQELHIDPIFKGIWCIWTMDVDQEGHRWAVNFYTRPGTEYDKNVYVRACR